MGTFKNKLEDHAPFLIIILLWGILIPGINCFLAAPLRIFPMWFPLVCTGLFVTDIVYISFEHLKQKKR